MSMLDRAKKYVAKNNFASDHPLLKLGVERDARDAYFDGLVFAALSDDEKIEEPERDYLAKAAQSLAIPEDEIDERLQNFIKSDPLNCGMEAVKSLPGKDGEVAKLFLCEFSRVWSSHHQSVDDLCEWRKQLSAWMHVFYDEAFFAKFDDVVAKVLTDPTAVYALCDDFDDDVIRYLFSEIADVENIFIKKREEEERAVLPHPLKNSLSVEQKEHYVNAVRNAVDETSGNSPTKVQQKGLHHLAISLGVNGNDARAESISKITESSFESEKRNMAFFLYCDIARLFAMDGHAEFSAIQNQKLDNVLDTMKLLPEDETEFLREYSTYLGNGKESDTAVVVQKAQSRVRFPEGFIRYFTPNMKPIALPGGDTEPGVYQIVDGHYRLENTLKVNSKTRLVIKNAIVDFASEAKIELWGSNVAISESEFNGEKTGREELIAIPFFDLRDNCTVSRCSFNGAKSRAAFEAFLSGNVHIDSCKFNELRGSDNHPIVKSHHFVCRKSQWANCVASNNYFETFQAEFVACDFMNCTMGSFVKTWLDSYLKITACLFEECVSNGRFMDYNEFDDDRSAKLENNCQLDCQGVDSSFSTAIEQLREARAMLEDGENENMS